MRQAAQRGDAKAKQAIRDWIRNSPGIREELGNVARYAERALIEHISGGEVLAAEAMTQQAAKMRRELAGASPSPLEEMQVERVVAAWLHLQDCEMSFLKAQADIHWAALLAGKASAGGQGLPCRRQIAVARQGTVVRSCFGDSAGHRRCWRPACPARGQAAGGTARPRGESHERCAQGEPDCSVDGPFEPGS